MRINATITGSILTMDQALRNVLATTGATLQQAIGMLSYNLALSTKAANCKGCLQAGYNADLAIFDATLTLQATMCRGNLACATNAWHNRLVENDTIL